MEHVEAAGRANELLILEVGLANDAFEENIGVVVLLSHFELGDGHIYEIQGIKHGCFSISLHLQFLLFEESFDLGNSSNVLSFDLLLLNGVGDGVILQLVFVHLHFAKFAGDKIWVLHRHPAEPNVLIHVSNRVLFEAKGAIAHLLLAEVGHVLVVGG